jgi:hypothetical protein
VTATTGPQAGPRAWPGPRQSDGLVQDAVSWPVSRWAHGPGTPRPPQRRRSGSESSGRARGLGGPAGPSWSPGPSVTVGALPGTVTGTVTLTMCCLTGPGSLAGEGPAGLVNCSMPLFKGVEDDTGRRPRGRRRTGRVRWAGQFVNISPSEEISYVPPGPSVNFILSLTNFVTYHLLLTSYL